MQKLLTMTKILVIEDEDQLREEVLEILGLEKFQVTGAENGQIGLMLARKIHPDLILCDVMMPEMGGHEVLEALRSDPSTATIPFIFLTAMSDKADLRQGMKLGADDYLTKPFSRSELLEAIAAQFRKQAAIDNKLQQKIDHLRSNISLALPHELHTPLTAIMGLSELMIEDYGLVDPKKGIEMLETIHSSAQRLYRLTQNFLLYAELELLTAEPKRIAVLKKGQVYDTPLDTLMEMALYRADKHDRAEDLLLELQDNALIPISELKFRKIVEEVVDNAFKFSTLGTLVRVVNWVEGDRFVFQVIDLGRGMTSEQIAEVGAYIQFERRLYEQQGTGLGLIIAKRLTELHGGTLTIDSIPTQGTTVTVTFPI